MQQELVSLYLHSKARMNTLGKNEKAIDRADIRGFVEIPEDSWHLFPLFFMALNNGVKSPFYSFYN